MEVGGRGEEEAEEEEREEGCGGEVQEVETGPTGSLLCIGTISLRGIECGPGLIKVIRWTPLLEPHCGLARTGEIDQFGD